jgi:hypothetical protein
MAAKYLCGFVARSILRVRFVKIRKKVPQQRAFMAKHSSALHLS